MDSDVSEFAETDADILTFDVPDDPLERAAGGVAPVLTHREVKGPPSRTLTLKAAIRNVIQITKIHLAKLNNLLARLDNSVAGFSDYLLHRR